METVFAVDAVKPLGKALARFRAVIVLSWVLVVGLVAPARALSFLFTFCPVSNLAINLGSSGASASLGYTSV